MPSEMTSTLEEVYDSMNDWLLTMQGVSGCMPVRFITPTFAVAGVQIHTIETLECEWPEKCSMWSAVTPGIIGETTYKVHWRLNILPQSSLLTNIHRAYQVRFIRVWFFTTCNVQAQKPRNEVKYTCGG